jgi:riboflavin kinase/FMN adenylyltransferase
MNLLRTTGPWDPAGRKVCVAIGVFDGVHLGHQRILRQTIEDARAVQGLSVAVTFDRHPNEIVAPQYTPPLLYPLSKKLRALEALGIDIIRLIHFDKAFSQVPAEQFVRDLASDARHLECVCVGAGFSFGHQRRGNVELLRRLGAKLQYRVHALDDVELNGETIRSTRVREVVREGKLELAGHMLGRPYTLSGVVLRGAQLGRKLGFPTANISVSGIVTPPTGVYIADAALGGLTRRAAVNIGFRPTVDPASAALQVEAHLLDFSDDIYDQELELTFVRKLRDEQKFPSLEALRAQVARDIAQARLQEDRRF